MPRDVVARRGIIDRLPEEVVNKLLDSGMIKITWIGDFEDRFKFHFVKIPEVLACAVSSRFRDICKATIKRSFTIEEVLDKKVVEANRMVYDGAVYEHLHQFLRWLYGGFDLEFTFCERWFFGQAIGSPFYQNDCVRVLCSMVDPAATNLVDLCEYYDHYDLVDLWDQSDFTPDQGLGYDSEKQIHWDNKQMLHFVLDAFAFFGTEDDEVRKLFSAGGPASIFVAGLIDSAARTGGFDGAPWEEKNIHKYLVEESLPENESEDEHESDEDESDDESESEIEISKALPKYSRKRKMVAIG